MLDGFGCAPPGPGNAVELADTPVFDRLWSSYPHTTIEASGEAAGLPPGQMGNSEVGHLTIGAGRRLYQDLMRVNRGIEDGSFLENEVLKSAFERGRRVHLLGLVSHGGVHSHIDHVQALLRFAPEKTWIHAFTDGRDVSPTSAVRDLALLPQDRIASVIGRYWAMDRDQRWDRTQRAYDAVVEHKGRATTDVLQAVQASYDAGVTDEFIEPIVVDGAPSLEHGDTAIFFNFRPDRGRQLTRMLLDGGFDVTTMTRYSSELQTPIAFAEHEVQHTLAEVLSKHGVRQLHAAETEKYAHVTYFFNGGREEAWPGEERVLVPSPRDVAGLRREAGDVGRRGCRTASSSGSGTASASVSSTSRTQTWSATPARSPPSCGPSRPPIAVSGRVVERTTELGGVCLVTADHGNAENMLEPDGESPHTAHTTNPVPLVATLREGLVASTVASWPISLRPCSLCSVSSAHPTCRVKLS